MKPQNRKQSGTSDDESRQNDNLPAVGSELPKLTVSNLIEAIESSPKQASKASSTSEHLSVGNSPEIPGIKQSRGGDFLEKDWQGGRAVKKNRTVAAPFDITKLKISPAKAQYGDTIYITFQATNTSAFYSIYPVTIKVNGQVIAAEVISVPPGFTLPMRISVVGAQPGDYQVEVNFASGKFLVNSDSVPDDLTMKDFDVAKLDAEFDRTVSEPVAAQKRKGSFKEANVIDMGRRRGFIDWLGDYIEIGLDKLGDALIFPIKKLAQLFSKGRRKS